MPPSRTDGIGASIRRLKKSPLAKLGVDLHRRSQLPAGFDVARHLGRVGHPPVVAVTGQRKSVKILGAIELWRTRFHYREDTVFNAESYLGFLEQLARSYRRQGAILIQDNASYHKHADVWSWFRSNRHWLEVHQLPPYSTELNPAERLWQHTRKTGTHNRYFASRIELETTLNRVFGDMQHHPALIRSYVLPFC